MSFYNPARDLPEVGFGIRAGFIEVDIALAQAMLTYNSKNRRLRKDHVPFLAEQMRQGKWMASPEGIAFDIEGTLIDGQHRLHAILKSGKPILLFVTWGWSVEVFKVLDNGIQRRPVDRVALIGELNSTQNKRVVNTLTRYRSLTKIGSKSRVTSDELLELWDQHKPVLLRTTAMIRSYKAPVFTAVIEASILHTMKGEHGKAVAALTNAWAEGKGDDYRHITDLRRTLLTMHQDRKAGGGGGSYHPTALFHDACQANRRFKDTYQPAA